MKLIVYCILLLVSSQCFAKEIALTFDDSPRFASGYFDGPTRAKKLIAGLKNAKVKEVAFFSVSHKIDEEGKSRLRSFAKAGHIIANHTHTHPNFNDLTGDEYVKDFVTADTILSKYPNYKEWFRFPFLREGNEASKRDMMRAKLNEMGYFNAYITVNNYDWYMESQFQREIKKNPKLDLEKVKNYYVDNLVTTVDFYDQMAVKHLKRSPKHVLLLHETDLNALFIVDLVKALRQRGWKIISPSEAYSDPIAKFAFAPVLKFNPGRIGEIAHSSGQTTGLWHESCDESYLDKEFQTKVIN